MSDEPITTTYKGHDLWYDETANVWSAVSLTESGIPMGTLAEVKRAIDVLEREKVDQQGVSVWAIKDDRAKYWCRKTAVYFTPSAKRFGDPHRVHTRNGGGLYPYHCGDLAPDTEEARAAIEKAKAAYQEAIAASKRYEEARRSIPRVKPEMLAHLPDVPARR